MTMSKYISKAEEISRRIQSILDAFQVRKGQDGWPDEYTAPAAITDQYPDVLFDVQNLIFCDSPQHPLLARSLELNERRRSVMESVVKEFRYEDFVTLKGLISKYIQYRNFLEASD